MDEISQKHFKNIDTSDRDMQNSAYYGLMEITDKPVAWAYEVWDELLQSLQHKDNHVRAIAGQLLANLAKSDPEKRILKDFAALKEATKDEKFVTARHIMQSLWKIGIVGAEQQAVWMNSLEARYQECVNEKNSTLIRFDIIQSFRNVYDVVKDEAIKTKALALIESETDPKYRKKYASLWKK